MTDKVGHEFWVIMQKRTDGEVYCNLAKTTEKIYLLKEDAEKEFEGYPLYQEYFHIVKMIAYLENNNGQ